MCVELDDMPRRDVTTLHRSMEGQHDTLVETNAPKFSVESPSVAHRPAGRQSLMSSHTQGAMQLVGGVPASTASVLCASFMPVAASDGSIQNVPSQTSAELAPSDG